MPALIFQEQLIPSAFKYPWGVNGNRKMLQDFHSNPDYAAMRNFAVPAGKKFVSDMTCPYDVAEINGKNHQLGIGMTHASDSTKSVGFTTFGARDERGGLVDDNDWCDISYYNSGRDTTKWRTNQIIGRYMGIMLLDWEHHGGPADSPMISRMTEIVAEMAANGTKIGLWGQGSHNPIPLNQLDNGLPTGVYNSTGAQQWRQMYNTPGLRSQPIVAGTGMQVSNPFNYHTAYGDARQIYALMLHHDLSKIQFPNITSIPSIWQESEHIDGYQQQTLTFYQPGNPAYNYPAGVYGGGARLQAPASRVFSDASWGAVWDGFHYFGLGRIMTNSPEYSWAEGDSPLHAVKNHLGENIIVRYPHKYFGTTNLVHLALWQMSQDPVKQIIESNTPWLMPKYTVTAKTNGTASNVLRQGDSIFPSYPCLYREPLIKIKYNQQGTKVYIIAQNPCNEFNSVETVKIQDPNSSAWETTIQLKGGWPTKGFINL